MFKLIKKTRSFYFLFKLKNIYFKKNFISKEDLQYENDLYQLVKEEYLFSVTIY